MSRPRVNGTTITVTATGPVFIVGHCAPSVRRRACRHDVGGLRLRHVPVLSFRSPHTGDDHQRPASPAMRLWPSPSSPERPRSPSQPASPVAARLDAAVSPRTRRTDPTVVVLPTAASASSRIHVVVPGASSIDLTRSSTPRHGRPSSRVTSTARRRSPDAKTGDKLFSPRCVTASCRVCGHVLPAFTSTRARSSSLAMSSTSSTAARCTGCCVVTELRCRSGTSLKSSPRPRRPPTVPFGLLVLGAARRRMPRWCRAPGRRPAFEPAPRISCVHDPEPADPATVVVRSWNPAGPVKGWVRRHRARTPDGSRSSSSR